MKPEQRVAALEDRVARLLPDDPLSGDFEPLLAWMTGWEIDMLEEAARAWSEDPAAGQDFEQLLEWVRRRAAAREAAGVDMQAASECELASRRWLKLPDGGIVGAYQDALDGMSRIDPIYRRRQPKLPKSFTNIEIEAWIGPRRCSS